MQCFPPTIIIRHRKENLKKCSLRGLESRNDTTFLEYPRAELPDLEGYVALSIDGELLSEEDADKGLLLLDGTWRYADKMSQWLEGQVELPKRRIPSHYRTAYPRKQTDCPEPECGLASVEALYVAYQLLGRDATGLLDYYYWAEEFLKRI